MKLLGLAVGAMLLLSGCNFLVKPIEYNNPLDEKCQSDMTCIHDEIKAEYSLQIDEAIATRVLASDPSRSAWSFSASDPVPMTLASICNNIALKYVFYQTRTGESFLSDLYEQTCLEEVRIRYKPHLDAYLAKEEERQRQQAEQNRLAKAKAKEEAERQRQQELKEQAEFKKRLAKAETLVTASEVELITNRVKRKYQNYQYQQILNDETACWRSANSKKRIAACGVQTYASRVVAGGYSMNRLIPKAFHRLEVEKRLLQGIKKSMGYNDDQANDFYRDYIHPHHNSVLYGVLM